MLSEWNSKVINKTLREEKYSLFYFYIIYFCLFAISWAAPEAHGGSQARGWIRATAAGLCHSHSHAGSLIHWARPGIEPMSSWILVGFLTTDPRQELQESYFRRQLIYQCLWKGKFKSNKYIYSVSFVFFLICSHVYMHGKFERTLSKSLK